MIPFVENDRDQDGFTGLLGDYDRWRSHGEPTLAEIPYNGKDDDCSERTCLMKISDRDGFLAIQVGGDDCDDNNPVVNPDGSRNTGQRY